MISLTKSLKQKYEINGYVVIKNFLDSRTIMNAKNNLDQYLAKRINKSGKRINLTKNKKINSVHKLDDWKWTKKIQKDNEVRKVVQFLIGEKISDFGAELFAKPAKVGLASPIHQDNYYWCLKGSDGLTVWIALDKADKSNGAVYYYRGSHQLGLLEHVPSFAPGSSQTLKYPYSMKLFKKDIPSLNAGDCLIHNCLVVHGSNKNLSNKSRIGWTLRYKSKRNRIDLMRKKHYLKELKLQQKNM